MNAPNATGLMSYQYMPVPSSAPNPTSLSPAFYTQQYMPIASPQAVAEVATSSNWLNYLTKNIEKEQALTLARSILWYFGWPLFFFIVLAPGFLISLPPAIDCDDGIRKPIAPERTTVANVFLHSVIFIALIVFMYWFGAHVLGIMFPFTAGTLKTLTK